ncbi:MAG: sigma-70 family RNA polymerase sigma factor [Actinomycetia bacterium]|nr:sigma-70 family RNA polymerase sigma factor [Actinomycetes bacterium]MCP4227558.1 sigma-70 family RNA polymerase sigma factor [Actinomycetes bacterium]MCP5034419.1 sigma-70 family RNA polymerase sigma factor [Actinomycetes bacterium]
MIPDEESSEPRPRPAGQCAVGEMDSQSATGQLLAAALAGDRDAWARIVKDYSNLLWWIARSHRLDDATAADVVQTVWLQLVRFGDRVQDPERLPSWLATTARREAQRRLSSRDIPSGWIGDEVDRTVPAADERIIDDETIGVVLAAFAHLSNDDQRLLRLVCDVPPRSYEEIASLLGKSQGYVGPTRQRALRRLRALLSEMGLW